MRGGEAGALGGGGWFGAANHRKDCARVPSPAQPGDSGTETETEFLVFYLGALSWRTLAPGRPSCQKRILALHLCALRPTLSLAAIRRLRRLSRALSAFLFNARACFRCLPACSSALREGPGCSAGPIDSLREWPAQRVLSDSDHDSDCESDRVTTKACNAGPAARRPCGESSARVAQIPRHA